MTEEINPPNISKTVGVGIAIIAAFFLIFGIWAFSIPIESAAVAEGIVVVKSMRKSVQHLDGGVIKKLFVREGTTVSKGEPLIQLDDAQAATIVHLLQGQEGMFMGSISRLKSEIDEFSPLRFPPSLLEIAEKHSDVKKALIMQLTLLTNNHTVYQNSIDLIGKRITQLQKLISSLQAQVVSVEKQSVLIAEETEGVAELEKKKLIGRPTLFALQRKTAVLEQEREKLMGEIAKSEVQIDEAHLQIISYKESRQTKSLENLQKEQEKLFEIKERLKIAENTLKRTTILSPASGIVVNLQYHTEGGVILPGKQIMEVVPMDDKLVIEAFIDPLDIDIVHPGLIAKIRLLAYKQRTTPVLMGKVVNVSADVLVNEVTQQRYYLAKVIVDKKELENLGDAKLYPGMPVQVMLITGELTLFQYLLVPLKESFQHAFREQ